MQGIFQKENTDKALKYGIYRHLPTYEKIIRNLVSFCIKKKIDGKWILRVYSMLKNYIVLFLLNSLLGLNTFTDAKDIYYSIVGLFPFLESDFLKNGMFIILWIVLSFSEVYIIKVYTNLFILRMNKNKMMK